MNATFMSKPSAQVWQPNHPALVAALPLLYKGQLFQQDEASALDALVAWLQSDEAFCAEHLFPFARDICFRHKGEGVLLRGIVEFSNVCRNTCGYCGLFIHNTGLERYTLSDEQILHCVSLIEKAGLRTVVLQSGERQLTNPQPLASLISTLRQQFPSMAITLSVGEHPASHYALWHAAGAHRYLLKIETADPEVYAAMHPDMTLENRLACLSALKAIGYQVGSGGIVGLPGQTPHTLARDLLFYRQQQFGMTSLSPLIPHAQTPLAQQPSGELSTTLIMVALARILCPNTHIPATTAMGSLNGKDYRPQALDAGANVVMLNFTPLQVKRLYEIYPGKRCLNEAVCAVGCIRKMVATVGRTVDFAVGHAHGYCEAEVPS